MNPEELLTPWDSQTRYLRPQETARVVAELVSKTDYLLRQNKELQKFMNFCVEHQPTVFEDFKKYLATKERITYNPGIVSTPSPSPF